jgi:molecular chaperone GrpE
MSPKSKTKKLEENIAKLEASLDDERKRAEKYLSLLKYAKADLENLQKQTQKQIDMVLSRANGRLLMQLLPLLDELHLAIEVSNTGNGDIVEGVEMVRGKLEKLMAAEGVSPIKAIGEPFDPRLHEAVLEVETHNQPDGTVIEELRKGYKFKDRVLRASMVKVVRNPGSDEYQEENEDE